MKKNQFQQNDNHFAELPIGDEENKFVEWLTLYYKELGACFAAFLILLFAFLIYSASSSSKAETDYFMAQKDYKLSQSDDPAIADAAFIQLQEIINRRPELNAKYDGILSQKFINLGQIPEAEKFANLSFARTHTDDLPFYTDYAKNTLLIAQKNYKDAVNNSNSLKNNMLADTKLSDQDPKSQPFGDVLFGYNLVRIAMLYQQMEMKNEELNAWKELKMYANLDPAPANFKFLHPTSVQIIFNNFQEGKASLQNYIDYREKLLTAR